MGGKLCFLPLSKAIADLRKLLSSVKVRWYVFGAQAAIIYGSNWLTSDVDITLDMHGTPVAVLLKALAKYGFEPQFPDRRFIEVTQVIPVVHVKTKLPVDLVLAGPGLEDEFFERVVMITIGSTKIPFASPEDLVVMKVLSGRPKDLDDIACILAAHRDTLDIAAIKKTLSVAESVLDQSDLLSIFAQLLKPLRAIKSPSGARTREVGNCCRPCELVSRSVPVPCRGARLNEMLEVVGLIPHDQTVGPLG